MPSKARLLAKSMIESPILSEITTNPTVTPTTITSSINTAVDDVATGNFASIDLLPNTGNDVGDLAFVQATDRLYIWSSEGWYNIALVNTTPTWDSGGQPNASYILDTDSPLTATTITLAASDPEGFPVSYNYVTSGSMDSIATISQDSSVFTITPKTSTQAPDGGTGTITFRATDGTNILPQVSSFSLTFGTNITTPSGYPFASSAGTNTFDLQGIHNFPTANAGFSSTLRTGKIYIELVMGSNTSDRGMIGLCPNEITSAGYETANTFSLYSVFGSKYPGTAGNGVDIGLEPFNDTGDIVMFAYDTSTREVWAGVNGTWHQDPSTTSSSYTIGTASTTEFKLMFGSANNSQYYNGTIITGNGTLNYTLPTGFEAH